MNNRAADVRYRSFAAISALLALLVATSAGRAASFVLSGQTSPFASDANFSRSGNVNAQVQDTRGNEALAAGTLAFDAGSITLNAHGCSGGLAPSGGSANGTAQSNNSDQYTLVSSTLPVGTTVPIMFTFAAAARATTRAADVFNIGEGATSQVYVSYGISGDIDTSGTVGTLAAGEGQITQRSQVDSSGSVQSSRTRTGTYDFGEDLAGSNSEGSNHVDVVFNMRVGRPIYFSIQGRTQGDSSAFGGGGSADADAQVAILWGLTPGSSEALLVAGDGSGSILAPPASGATEPNAMEALPERPIPEPTGIAVLLFSAMLLRRTPSSN